MRSKNPVTQFQNITNITCTLALRVLSLLEENRTMLNDAAINAAENMNAELIILSSEISNIIISNITPRLKRIDELTLSDVVNKVGFFKYLSKEDNDELENIKRIEFLKVGSELKKLNLD